MKNVPYIKYNNIRGKISLVEMCILKKGHTDLNELSKEEILKLKKDVLEYNLKYGVDSLTHLELEGLTPTLGFEIETVMGSIDEEDQEFYNMSAEHDGSLRGPNGEDPTGGEYVTGILYGDSGFKHLYEICKILNKNCSIDQRAGVHVHIGNLNWNNSDILYSYLLALKIESQIMKVLPKSRRNNKYCRNLLNLVERDPQFRNYLEELMNFPNRQTKEIIEELLFRKLFTYVSGGREVTRNYNTNFQHPDGPKCGYNKSSQRYCWFNLVPMVFNTRGSNESKTIEIRNHSGTMNYTKIKNWAKFWVAFTNYVSNNKRAILLKNPTMDDIIRYSYPKSGEKLIEYFNERRSIFSPEINASESIDWETEIQTNKSFKQILR